MTDAQIEAVCRFLHQIQGTGDPDAPLHAPAQSSWDVPSLKRWQQWDEAARGAIEVFCRADPRAVAWQYRYKSDGPGGKWHTSMLDDRDDELDPDVYEQRPLFAHPAARDAYRIALEKIAGEQNVYKGHGDFDTIPAYEADEAQAIARAALSARSLGEVMP